MASAAADVILLAAPWGAPEAETPHVERLAREGRLFPKCYAASTDPAAARAALAAGRRVHWLRAWDGTARAPSNGWAEELAEARRRVSSLPLPADRAAETAARALDGLLAALGGEERFVLSLRLDGPEAAAAADATLGRLRETLEAAGRAGPARILFLGLPAPAPEDAERLREAALTGPLVLWGEGVTPGVTRTPVEHLDLHPTILRASGLGGPPPSPARPGVSLFDVGAWHDDPTRPILAERHGPAGPAFAVRRGRWKLVAAPEGPDRLHDLVADPGEARDLSGDPACAAIRADMRALLHSLCDPVEIAAAARADMAE